MKIALFGDETPNFTGLSQVTVLSDIPRVLQTFTVELLAFATKEKKWRAADQQMLQNSKKTPVSEWDQCAGQLIKTAETNFNHDESLANLECLSMVSMIALNSTCGIKARFTFQHPSYGANQGFEDVLQPLAFLVQHDLDHRPPSTALTEQVFVNYECVYLPHPSALTIGIRKQRGSRISEDIENNMRSSMKDDDAVTKAFDRHFGLQAQAGQSVPTCGMDG
ncbi:hypothetical protein EW146_g4878 [Bondarzewia mesenterica]|uniref:Uncharacterized protein n=1 Tax=Bondarzewia mesenterica TaxID=1095465 RepID=A0A4S4LT79_9AGAM|nr:hypothetical protein EW146_g4878 [Bondarzewia mesenterica]